MRAMGVTIVAMTLVLTVAARAADAGWPCWRGPNHDCVVADGTKVAVWGEKGPLKLWDSETIRSLSDGGVGSTVVSGDRVFLFATPKANEALTTRALTEQSFCEKLGWSPFRMPAELGKAVEAARISDERNALKQNDVGNWVNQTKGKLLTTDDDRRRHDRVVNDRLWRGTNALSLEALDKLAALVGRTFKDQAALDKWFDANQVDAAARAQVMSAIPTSVQRVEDVIYCFKASDGKTVWKRSYPGVGRSWGSSSTPCVADGRVYVLGSDCMLYCLDAKDGKEIWTAKPTNGERHASFIVVDGLAIVECGALLAYDAATGTLVWSRQEAGANNNTPTPWVKDGKTYLLCNSEWQVCCVDPRTNGKILWVAKGGCNSTAAVSGDTMVVFNGSKLLAYRISLEKAEPLWQTDVGGDRGASPAIYKDRVYLAENGRTLCVALADGKILWDGKTSSWELGSAVIADDKVIVVGDRSVSLLSAAPEKFEQLVRTSVPGAPCVTPAIVNSRMYLRLCDSVACFDTTQSAPTNAPAAK